MNMTQMNAAKAQTRHAAFQLLCALRYAPEIDKETANMLNELKKELAQHDERPRMLEGA